MNLYVREPWLSYINDGSKKIEGRVGAKSRFEPSIGSMITLYNDTSSIKVRLVDVRHYDRLMEYLETEGYKNVAPHATSIDDARRLYLEIYTASGLQVFSDNNIIKVGGMNALVIEHKC